MTEWRQQRGDRVRRGFRRALFAFVFAMPWHGAVAATFPLPPEGEAVVGEIRVVSTRFEDTLLDVARKHGLGYEEIVRANPHVDPWLPGEGTEVVLPTRFILPPGPRTGIVLNLPEFRLYYYPVPAEGSEPVVVTHPISIGRMDWSTPIGRARVVQKVVDPTWYPPASIREEHAADGRPLPGAVPPGPRNPLGRHAMKLDLPGYLIHGTNRPAGVGMRVTHGCIRMYPENIAELFTRVPIDTPVQIINEPFKAGWGGDALYLEAHVPLEENREAADAIDLTLMTRAVVAATEEHRADIDWDAAEVVFRARLGVPEPLPGSSRKRVKTNLSASDSLCAHTVRGLPCILE